MDLLYARRILAGNGQFGAQAVSRNDEIRLTKLSPFVTRFSKNSRRATAFVEEVLRLVRHKVLGQGTTQHLHEALPQAAGLVLQRYDSVGEAGNDDLGVIEPR